ncbi:MAG: hypothetical protein OHK93_004579 [Ramalina farinacea]|uniref:Period n=1 Tax=Ramalina farinacea TaxID=258253 RepID=A0AA43TV66_9LECA|nr:hypothetical protein [Ramalina farinacea]
MRSTPLYLALVLASFAVALPQGSVDTTDTGDNSTDIANATDLTTNSTDTTLPDTTGADGNSTDIADTTDVTTNSTDTTLPDTTGDGTNTDLTSGTGTGASAPLGTGTSGSGATKSSHRQGGGMPLLSMKHQQQRNNSRLTTDVKAAIDTILAAYPKVQAAEGPKFMDIIVNTDENGQPIYHLSAFAAPPPREHHRNATGSDDQSMGGMKLALGSTGTGTGTGSSVVPGVASSSGGAYAGAGPGDSMVSIDSS